MLYHHLRHYHDISSGVCQAIVSKYEGLPVAQEDADVTPLPSGSLPLPFLAAPVRGYSCSHCPWLEVNWGEFRKHLTKTNNLRKTKVQREDVSCFLQQWISYRKIGRYWRVDTAQKNTIDSLKARTEEKRAEEELAHGGKEDCCDPDMAELLRMEDEEEQRLGNEAEANLSLPVELEHDENTPWLRQCGWPRWFACRPLHMIAATSQLPSPKPEDLYLGSWNGTEWISCLATETKLLKLVELASCALDRCEETLSSTTRVLCCWLCSWGPHYCPIPFELPQRQATRKKYRSYCYRFHCYVFRARQVCLAQGQDAYDIYGLTLTAPQAEIVDTIWAELGMSLPNKAGGDLSSPLLPMPPLSPCILETIFWLLVLFWTDTSIAYMTIVVEPH